MSSSRTDSPFPYTLIINFLRLVSYPKLYLPTDCLSAPSSWREAGRYVKAPSYLFKEGTMTVLCSSNHYSGTNNSDDVMMIIEFPFS